MPTLKKKVKAEVVEAPVVEAPVVEAPVVEAPVVTDPLIGKRIGTSVIISYRSVIKNGREYTEISLGNGTTATLSEKDLVAQTEK